MQLGYMRTYNMLKAKVKRFYADPEIQALLKELNGGDQTDGGLLSRYTSETAQKLQTATFAFQTMPKEKLHFP